MKILQATMWMSAGAAVLGVMGCDVFLGGHARHDRVYVEQQPRYVEARPQYVEAQPQYVEQQPTYVIVRQAPPPVRVERRPAPPSQTHIWIDGYWNWDSQRYTWEAGRYAVPPQPDVVWIAPRYESSSDGTRYTAGRWTKNNPGNGRGRGRGN